MVSCVKTRATTSVCSFSGFITVSESGKLLNKGGGEILRILLNIKNLQFPVSLQPCSLPGSGCLSGLFPPPRNLSASVLGISENAYPENGSPHPLFRFSSSAHSVVAFFSSCMDPTCLGGRKSSVLGCQRCSAWQLSGPALFPVTTGCHRRLDSRGANCLLPALDFAD